MDTVDNHFANFISHVVMDTVDIFSCPFALSIHVVMDTVDNIPISIHIVMDTVDIAHSANFIMLSWTMVDIAHFAISFVLAHVTCRYFAQFCLFHS
jgi:hypothetical protein